MRCPLIELRHVTVALNGRLILRDLTWSLHEGEHWSVVGANGTGKSTFLRLLRGELWPAPGAGQRTYRLNGIVQTTAVGVKEHIALVSPESQQRYLQQEWTLTAREVVQTGFAQTDLLYTPLEPGQKHAADELAQRLGITSLLRRNVQTLSTGELRKVLIARALVGQPKILLLDEVCDGLDAVFRREMLAFIDDIARHTTQIIYTTHRADESVPAITHRMVFEGGRIAQCEAERPATPRMDRGTKLNRRRKASAVTAEQRVDEIESKVSLSGDSGSRCPEDSALISITGATVYLGRTPVLRSIDWRLCPGENWVVLGGNGAGKTTFLKLVASELYPAVGADVRRFGLTRRHTIWDLRKRIGCVSPLLQTHYRESLTAAEVVASGFFSSIGLMDRVTPVQRRRVNELLSQFGLVPVANKPMTALSFGELRKILTLRALVHRPRLLILDEPFDGLDAVSRRDFRQALDRIARAGTQLLIVTHHLDDLPGSINRGLLLREGRIAVAGEWPEIRGHIAVQQLFGVSQVT